MKKWYTIYSKSRQERLALENLQRQAFETYLPLIQERKQRRGKWAYIIEPLFPRYLFVRLNVEEESTAVIRSTRGVTSMVRFGNDLVPVADTLIDALKQTVDPESGVHNIEPHTFKTGDPVVVVNGPFKDLAGIFQASTGAHRALILLELLGRMNPVTIGCEALVVTGR